MKLILQINNLSELDEVSEATFFDVIILQKDAIRRPKELLDIMQHKSDIFSNEIVIKIPPLELEHMTSFIREFIHNEIIKDFSIIFLLPYNINGIKLYSVISEDFERGFYNVHSKIAATIASSMNAQIACINYKDLKLRNENVDDAIADINKTMQDSDCDILIEGCENTELVKHVLHNHGINVAVDGKVFNILIEESFV